MGCLDSSKIKDIELNRLEVSSRFTEVKGLPEEGELALLTCIPLPHSRCSSSINVRTTFPFLLGIDTPQGGSDTLGE